MNKVVAHWMEKNLPERYWYQLGADGTAEQAYAALCKDALQAMPGNQRVQQLKGARELYDRLDEDTDLETALAEMEGESA